MRSCASARRSPPSRPPRSSARPPWRPSRATRKVLILHEFHLLNAVGAGRLLKTIEEPPASTHFIVLADFVPVDLVTIASRCVRIEFAPIAAPALAARLVAEGTQPGAGRRGGGRRRRRPRPGPPARRRPTVRRAAPAPSPSCRASLDGTGATVVAATTDLLGPHRGGRGAAGRPTGARARRARRARAAPRHAAAAGGRRSRRGTSASCAGTAPTSCAAGWRRSPRTYRDALVDGTAAHDDAVDRRGPPHPRHASSRSSTTPTRR